VQLNWFTYQEVVSFSQLYCLSGWNLIAIGYHHMMQQIIMAGSFCTFARCCLLMMTNKEYKHTLLDILEIHMIIGYGRK
jgi:hypothetical protein